MEKSIEEVNHLNLVRLSAVYMRQPETWRLTAEHQPSWREGDLRTLQHRDQEQEGKSFLSHLISNKHFTSETFITLY